MYPPGETHSRKRASGSFPPGAFDPNYAPPAYETYGGMPQQNQGYYSDWNNPQSGYGIPPPGPGMYPSLNQPRKWKIRITRYD